MPLNGVILSGGRPFPSLLRGGRTRFGGDRICSPAGAVLFGNLGNSSVAEEIGEMVMLEVL